MTTATGPGGIGTFNFTAMFHAYSELAVHYNGTSSGQAYDVASDYHVIYASSTTYKVNITQTTQGSATTYIAWVLKNGTAIAVYANGQNYTGFYASSFFSLAMLTYIFELAFTSPNTLAALTSAFFVHSTGSSTVMIGPTQVMVTDYVANNLPLVINQCGVSTDFTKFSLSLGNVSGETVTLLTNLRIAGMFSSGGTSSNVDFSLTITSVTKA